MRSPSSRVLTNRVDIYKSTSGRDTDGGVVFSYPALPSFRAAPCTVQPHSSAETEDQGRITKIVIYKIMFGSYLGLSPRDLIVWVDPQGVTHRIFANADRDEAGRGAAWTVFAEERS